MTPQNTHAKFRIYEGILCLETDEVGTIRSGKRWWDWGVDLAYTPYPINKIEKFKVGKLMNSPRTVMAVLTPAGWVAVNLPRTDIITLQKLNLYPNELPPPYLTLQSYTPWPEKL